MEPPAEPGAWQCTCGNALGTSAWTLKRNYLSCRAIVILSAVLSDCSWSYPTVWEGPFSAVATHADATALAALQRGGAPWPIRGERRETLTV